jgi:predicted 3-demethylubiquinone-9 3-methyltransferase (glyoxalase superfamily)
MQAAMVPLLGRRTGAALRPRPLSRPENSDAGVGVADARPSSGQRTARADEPQARHRDLAPRSRGARGGPGDSSEVMPMPVPKNIVCLWFDKDAEAAARFYTDLFPDSAMGEVFHAPGDYPSGKAGDVLTVTFTVAGIPCLGLNGGPAFRQTEAFSFQIATDDQEETDRYWNAIVGNGGTESACGWCKDRWGLSWQITPRTLTDALAAGGAEAGRAFAAMMEMGKIDVAAIDAARRG